MVKTTREGENRRSPRIASSAGTRLKEEQTASQIRSPGSMKGDTPVDPTEPPDSKFMTASKQPALTLVASAAAEDHGRQLPDSAFASENQAACMNPACAYTTPTRDLPLFPNEPAITHSATCAYTTPARDSLLFSNEPALAPTTGEDLSPLPVGSTDPRKTDAAPPAAASPPGNPRGSDGPTGDACESTSGTRGFRTAMYDATIGTRTLGEVRVPRTSEEHLLGRDGTASFGNPRGTDGPSRRGALAEGSAFEEPHLRGRDGTTTSAPGGALGRATASFGNPPRTDGASRGEALAEGSAFEDPHLRGRDGTTASAPGGALGRATASVGNPRRTDGPSRGGALAEGPAFQEPRARGRERIRFLDGTTAGTPGGAFGRVAASFGNPRGTDSPSGGEALAEGSVLEEPRSLPTRYFLEQRPDPNLFHLKSLHHAAPPELSCPSASARKADHFGHGPFDPVPRKSPDSASFPDALVNLTLATERPGSSQYVILKKGKTKATIGQRESTQGTPPVIDDAPQEDEVVDYGDGSSDSLTDDHQVTDAAALTIMGIQHLLKHFSLHEKFRILGLRNVEAPTSLTACSTVEGREPGMSRCQNRDTLRDRLPHPSPAGGSHAPHFPYHLVASSTITPQRTTTAISPQIPQATAPEFTRTSAAMSENERVLCQSRLKTLFPEVERARAAVRAAEEAGEAAKETLNREREGLKLETKQMWTRYEQRRALELARVAKAIHDAKAKVRGLEEDYVSYKNRGAAAEARLRGLVDGLVQTSPSNTGQSSCDGRPSAAPVSPALPRDSKEDPNILSISAELTKFRKLRELHPELSMKEYVDFRTYFDGKNEAAGKSGGMDRAESGWPSQEDPRSQAPPRGTTGATTTGAGVISAGGAPESATLVTDLLRDPGGTRRVIAPTLAQIPPAATTTVAATGVGRKKNEIALQIPPPPDRPRLNNFLLSLSQDSSK